MASDISTPGSAPAPVPVTAAEREAEWLAKVYRPSDANLTVRAVLIGMLIGAAMCLSNLYVFFKTGWSMGVTLTACILAFGVFQVLQRVGLVKKPLGALENNALTTVASGAGYMTGGGNMAAFGALLMVTTVRPDTLSMVAWFGLIAALGVFAAIPIKRQLINHEGLAFPTGTATAETISSIHEAAAGSGRSKASWLGWSAVFAAVFTWLRDAWHWIPGAVGLPLTLGGRALAEWTLALKAEVVLIGGGALMSFRTGWSLLLGGILTYAVLAPALLQKGIITSVSYKAIVAWTLWPGAAILVASGLTSFALDYKSIARSFTGLTKVFRKKDATAETGISAVECPEWWFPAGFVILSPFVVFLMVWLFQIPMWAGIIAVPLAVVMGFVAARVTGETDVTPTKALGPVTQLIYGVITPGNLSGNIMSANVTGGIGLHAADLLTTLKTGWLLGAKPRHQLYAQLFGVIAGAIIVVPAFNIILPDPSLLGGEAWPAPSCVVWAGVSKAFSGGLAALHPTSKTAILVGLALGVALALLEKFAPKKLRSALPSPSGLGIAMVIPGSNCIAMFIGAAGAEFMRRRFPKVAERTVVPVASGLIAGESLMGILIAVLTVAHLL
ncbi:OPT family oligopeptide transporter [Opitutus sp. ER46]|uniref:OPT family oligopeptide transporter n=1 Tax=Opitutus sp. ER46 TaxID=2161864 RepID=UPI000D31412E|nr:OPT family oligopeptide transporter [Opitutus sp. ER46]PTX95724.1 peptide transporter [Opitutus sp. ER46]